ncbi:hypothetical protein [Enterococcus faecium]|uniref:hypothetical protein n=1 Tax=Enterococcus faecium TaxID=1352 RepID=UPI0035664BDA
MNDKQKVELANKEYDNLKIKNKIDIDKGNISIGYVSQVINNPPANSLLSSPIRTASFPRLRHCRKDW